MKTFERVERQRLSQLVADKIEEAIISGTLPVGARLPSEHSLAEQFDVSRNVVREAMKTLQERRLIRSVNGIGAFVSQPDSQATSIALSRYLRLMDTGSSVQALYEVRGILECSNARLAAKRADEQDLTVLADCLRRMEENTSFIENWSAADLSFHLAVANATHNPFLTTLLQPLVDQVRGLIADGYQVPGAVQTGLEAHQRVYQCIANHDPEGALQAMLDHLRDSEARVETVQNTA